MNKLSPKQLGLVFGLALALFHATWSLMIWLGVAQGFMNFILKMHMIIMPFKVGSFNLGYAATLVGVTFVIGYLMGWILGIFWNASSKRR